MDTSRVSFGEMVAAASGLALFIFMFLPWYGMSVEGVPDVGDTPTFNAWEAFDLIDIVLLLVAAIAVAVAVLRAADSMPELPAPAGTIVMGAGLVAVALIAFRILVTPGEDSAQFFGVEIEFTRRIGLFLGLAAAGGIAYGGYRQTQEPPGTGGGAPAAGGRPAAPATAPPPPGDGESAETEVPADRPGQPAPPSGPAQPAPPAQPPPSGDRPEGQPPPGSSS